MKRASLPPGANPPTEMQDPMGHRGKKHGSRARHAGLSLIEIGVVMIVISLSLAPVIRMIGGPSGASGNSAEVNSLKSKEALLANTMIEKVLAGDFSAFTCNNAGSPVAFNPKTDLPVAVNAISSVRRYEPCKSSNASADLWYQWTVVHLNNANNNNDMPDQNRYYQGTLNVMDADKNRLLTLPANFFYNDGPINGKAENTGIMLSMDRSGSMAWSSTVENNMMPVSGFSSPFMFYRYKAFPTSGDGGWGAWGTPFPANPPYKTVLDKTNNSQLDMVYAKQVKWSGPGPSPTKDGEDPVAPTPYHEAFPFAKANPSIPNYNIWGQGVLGSGNCIAPNDNDWIGPMSQDKNLAYTFLPEARQPLSKLPWNRKFDRRSVIQSLCAEKKTLTEWSNTVNTKLSRIEAARTASLALLLNLESKPNITKSLEIGFIPWGSYAAAEHKVAMEKPINGLFPNMRDKLLWINRADPADINSAKPVKLEGGTQIHDGIEFARQQLLAGSYDRRIIVLLTDGEPNPNVGSNGSGAYGTGGLRDYTKASLGCGVADPNRRITLFTVGLLQADQKLLQDMAYSTPSGQAFYADDIQDLTGIFETVSYQIQKLALLDTVDRYGLSVSNGDDC